MTSDEALAIVDLALHKRLSNIQEQLFRQTWEGKTYTEIAEACGYDSSYIRDVGYRLWQLLTKAFGERVTKHNLKVVILSQSKRFLEFRKDIAGLDYQTAHDSLTTTNLFSNPSKIDLSILQTEQRPTKYFREKLTKDISIDMILIYGGQFLMGSPETELERSDNESPQHNVIVNSFFLGRYPVTQEQWLIVAERYEKVNRELNPNPSYFTGAKRPVEQVSWYEAQEFCDRLAKKTKRPYRLPTEAEWEYACRAGTTTPFHFGETISSELANYDGSYTYANSSSGESLSETTSVDHFDIANEWGLCDMHGNVYEWCQDHWHRNYDGAPTDGSAWLTNDLNSPRVKRGGAWYLNPGACRSAFRNYSSLEASYDGLGLRVVCSAPLTLQHPTYQS